MNKKPKPKTKQRTITVRVPVELHDWLKRVGEMDRRKVGWVVRECVLNHIASLERQYLSRGMSGNGISAPNFRIVLNEGSEKRDG